MKVRYQKSMSWLKKSTVSINSIKPRISNTISHPKPLDAIACYDSFKKHWQQVSDIINKETEDEIKHDDILTVVNNLNQILALIQAELQAENSNFLCIEYLLHEKLLDNLTCWTLNTNRYNNPLRVEQLKIYEVLLCNLKTPLVSKQSFLKPLLRLLSSFEGECLPTDIEKRLVLLISQLCSSFSQDVDVLALFIPANDHQGNFPRFDIFSLLVQFVHRDGLIGEQARDSLLLCMSLSKNKSDVAEYITSKSNICPVLAAGLSGLYSLLPRKLNIESSDWFRFGPDDVYEFPELTNFINSLEFCNAVSQICHPCIRIQLLDYVYQAFLVPVMGPALLQDYKYVDGYQNELQLSTEEELIAATAYFELLLRSVTNPGLLHAFVKFILLQEFDGIKIINCFIQRIHSSTKLCIITLALLETLLELNCEDIMLELVLRYLIPCTHVMYSQRSQIQHFDPHCKSADRFLSLIINLPKDENETDNLGYYTYLKYARYKIQNCLKATTSWTYHYDGENPPPEGVKNEDGRLETEMEQTSLPSADEGSSGYESIKAYKDMDRSGNYDERGVTNPPSPSPSGNDSTFLEYSTDFPSSPIKHHLVYSSPKRHLEIIPPSFTNSSPYLGPFLTSLFEKVEDMFSLNFHVILRLTAVITRLAIYPQSLIRSLLMNDSLIFQPSIKSLFQILISLKQKLENKLKEQNNMNLKLLMKDAESFFNERLKRLSNHNRPSIGYAQQPFVRADSKRRSFSMAIGAMFKRNNSTSEGHMEQSSKGYRYIKGNSYNEERNKDNNDYDYDYDRNIVIIVYVFNEWLKELAAIAQEHTILY